MGTPEELSHADWLHIFTTKSSKYLPLLAESLVYFAGAWVALFFSGVDPGTLQLHGFFEKGTLPYIIGIAYGVIGAFGMYKLREFTGTNTSNNNNTNNTDNNTTTNNTNNNNAGEGDSTSTPKKSETPKPTTSEGDTNNTNTTNNNTDNNNGNNNSVDNTNNEPVDLETRVKMALCSGIYEAALMFVTLGIYIPACFSLTSSILLSAISAQLLGIAAREFMEGIVTIGIGLWVYLFVSYYTYIPGILFYPSTIAWVHTSLLFSFLFSLLSSLFSLLSPLSSLLSPLSSLLSSLFSLPLSHLRL